MSRSSRKSARSLVTLASNQGGYFTTKQAIAAGYDSPHRNYHVSAGNFERIDHGLYRLQIIPRSEHDEFVHLSLWSRNQKDEPQAVVSHQSALIIHELTELLPGKNHLTVPRTFRKTAPRGCVLHKAALDPKEIEERAGFSLTTPLRTLLDADASAVSTEQLEKAVKEALARGQVRRKTLENAVRQSSDATRLAELLSVAMPKAQ